jgi:hypothetical protein
LQRSVDASVWVKEEDAIYGFYDLARLSLSPRNRSDNSRHALLDLRIRTEFKDTQGGAMLSSEALVCGNT